MGWLFGKKKSRVKSPSSGMVSHEQSLSFNDSAMHDKVLHPDSIKSAAGVSGDLSFDTHDEGLSGSSLGLGSSSSPAPVPSRPMPKMVPVGEDGVSSVGSLGIGTPSAIKPMSSAAPKGAAQGRDLFVKMHDYKRILGEMKDLSSELSSLSKITKSLEHSEYNEEKNFLRMKDTVKKVHDKMLTVDRTLFSH